MLGLCGESEAERGGAQVYGRLWCSHKRPDKLTLRRNNFNVYPLPSPLLHLGQRSTEHSMRDADC